MLPVQIDALERADALLRNAGFRTYSEMQQELQLAVRQLPEDTPGLARIKALLLERRAAIDIHPRLTPMHFDVLCRALEAAERMRIAKEDLALDSDECIGVLRVMQALFACSEHRLALEGDAQIDKLCAAIDKAEEAACEEGKMLSASDCVQLIREFQQHAPADDGPAATPCCL